MRVAPHTVLVAVLAIAACKFEPPAFGVDGAPGLDASVDAPWLEPWTHRKSITLLQVAPGSFHSLGPEELAP